MKFKLCKVFKSFGYGPNIEPEDVEIPLFEGCHSYIKLRLASLGICQIGMCTITCEILLPNILNCSRVIVQTVLY